MSDRIVIKALLDPIYQTIQPTLFPQTGYATYKDPKSGRDCLIVESPQSMSNRLEELVLKPNSPNLELLPLFNGLPYVVLFDKTFNKIVASTVTLPHRIGTGYIAKHKESELGKQLIPEINRNGLHLTLFKYDPLSLIHGVFLSHLASSKNKKNQVTLDGDKSKVTRALTGRIEASNVVVVPVGGASKDPISASSNKWQLKGYFEGAEAQTKGSSLGMGNLPYYQEEYACETITATFTIDRYLLETYGLPEPAKNLLVAIAQWKVLKFLDSPIRLRTSEYDVVEIDKSGLEADLSDLEKHIPKLIEQCTKEGLFADPTVTEVAITLKEKEKSQPKTAKKTKQEVDK